MSCWSHHKRYRDWQRMALDKVPGDLRLYIGGLFTLRRKDALQLAGITHVLSVLRLPVEEKLFEGYVHKVVEVNDTDDENLMEHFPSCNHFIEDALNNAGAVLVHCAMGKSRSATVVCAYLMKHFLLTPTEALARLREARPFCEPNDGFMQQLDIYHQTRMTDDLDGSPAYQRWLYHREIEMSRACGQAPEADKIRFEDEHTLDESPAEFELRCRKCRRPLATSQYLLPHQPQSSMGAPALACAHYFLDPLSWMRAELEQGKLDGRLECPKCKTNVGKYAWQGMQCSCGDWVVPGISLTRSRIDQVKSRTGSGDGGMGIRLPPSGAAPNQRRRGGAGEENL